MTVARAESSTGHGLALPVRAFVALAPRAVVEWARRWRWRRSGVPVSRTGFPLFEGDDPTLETTELGRFFSAAKGRSIDKWHHYFEIYERHFERFRGRAVSVLEIGVQNGGSLAMWRHFFGPQAQLYGIDIDPRCRTLDGESGSVRIGSQDDPRFLEAVVAEMGGLDIVIDDGSHVSAHIRASFQALFPRLSDGGIYLIEDLHCSYWREFGGAYRTGRGVIDDFKAMVDDLNHHHHPFGAPAAIRDQIFALHFYDSVAVIEKRRVGPAKRSIRGVTSEVRVIGEHQA